MLSVKKSLVILNLTSGAGDINIHVDIRTYIPDL